MTRQPLGPTDLMIAGVIGILCAVLLEMVTTGG